MDSTENWMTVMGYLREILSPKISGFRIKSKFNKNNFKKPVKNY